MEQSGHQVSIFRCYCLFHIHVTYGFWCMISGLELIGLNTDSYVSFLMKL
jgi:hypothetical protein